MQRKGYKKNKSKDKKLHTGDTDEKICLPITSNKKKLSILIYYLDLKESKKINLNFL